MRTADPADAAAIAEVHVASWRHAYAGLLPGPVLDGLSTAQRTRQWRHVLRAGSPDHVIVADVDGAVCGFTSVGPGHDADSPVATGHLLTIYVRPAAWGMGVGRLLHDAGLGRLVEDGFDDAALWMLSTNARARRFYEHLGWERDGRIRVQQFGGAVVIDHRFTRSLPSARLPTVED